ncbi:MAG TPA: hypothetical protein ENK86_02975 [Campylobacterales bacterium]|nr:hypothetical protein [Campylobacterales bacterium]
MTPSHTLLSSLLALLIGSSLLNAESTHCVGGKCFASLAKQEKTEQTYQKNMQLIMTAYHQTAQSSEKKPFNNVRPANDFITMDVTQNSIVLDEAPLPATTITYSDAIEIQGEVSVDEALQIERGKKVQENGKTIILIEDDSLQTEYECEDEREIVVCDAELHECECV